MTLSFSQKFPDKSPTHFVEKIWQSIGSKVSDEQIDFYFYDHLLERKYEWDAEYMENCSPKIHTIRADEKNRWKEGMDIHFVINNRTKNRFQFAPILPVKKLQRIVIEWKECELDGTKEPFCWIDGKCVCHGYDAKNWSIISRNDGFDSTEDFFKWFSSDFTGKIIHWTNFSY